MNGRRCRPTLLDLLAPRHQPHRRDLFQLQSTKFACEVAVVDRLAHALGEHVRVERRCASEPEHLARLHVHRHERGLPPRDRLLAGLLNVVIDRQPQLVARLRRPRGELCAEVAAGVHLHAVGAVAPAQVAVVRVLDPRLPDAVALRHAQVALLLELGRVDLPHCPEQVRPDLVVRVLAQGHLLDVHAGIAVLVLEDVAVDGPGNVLLDGRRRERQHLELLSHVLGDRRRVHAEDLTKTVEQLLALLLAPGELVRRHHHRVARAVVDQDLAGAVDDPPARRLDVDVAHAVVVRFRAVAVAGEDLEVPQPEEDDPEQNEGDAADDRHAKGELRRDGRASLAIEIHRLVAPSPRPNARRSHSRPPVPGGQ